MKSLNYILLLIIVAMCCIGACRKPIPPKPFFPLDEEMRAYFAVPDSGSWYVYQDSASGVFDTMRVTNRGNNSGAPLPFIGEGYMIIYECSRNHRMRADVRTYEDYYAFDVSYPAGGGHYIRKEKGGEGFTAHEKVTVLDSLILSGETYYDVLQSEERTSFLGTFTKLWFAKDIGIIKKHVIGGGGGPDSVFYLVDLSLIKP
ncbi:MAG: hypothetical protein R3C61_23610 [Bacteroidia bacterium]